MSKDKLLEKKKKLKEKFDKEYDKVEGDESHFEDLKLEASKQAEVKTELILRTMIEWIYY